MLNIPNIVSLEVEIESDGLSHRGFALAEKYADGNFLIISRIYPNLSLIKVDIAIMSDRETVIRIYDDYGKLFNDKQSTLI